MCGINTATCGMSLDELGDQPFRVQPGMEQSMSQPQQTLASILAADAASLAKYSCVC